MNAQSSTSATPLKGSRHVPDSVRSSVDERPAVERGVVPAERETAHTDNTAKAAISGLQALAIQHEMRVNYERVIDETSSEDGSATDQKSLLSFKRLLKKPESLLILSLIWKESSFISQDMVQSIGMDKTFRSPITQHGLAIALSDEPSDVSALNSIVRSVSIAAQHFGLVQREAISPTKIALTGTEKLHDLMLRLSEYNSATLERIPQTVR